MCEIIFSFTRPAGRTNAYRGSRYRFNYGPKKIANQNVPIATSRGALHEVFAFYANHGHMVMPSEPRGLEEGGSERGTAQKGGFWGWSLSIGLTGDATLGRRWPWVLVSRGCYNNRSETGSTSVLETLVQKKPQLTTTKTTKTTKTKTSQGGDLAGGTLARGLPHSLPSAREGLLLLLLLLLLAFFKGLGRWIADIWTAVSLDRGGSLPCGPNVLEPFF